jgi:hypothetical protein
MLHALARGLGSLTFFALRWGWARRATGRAQRKRRRVAAPHERAFGLAVFNSGAALGSVCPPVIV